MQSRKDGKDYSWVGYSPPGHWKCLVKVLSLERVDDWIGGYSCNIFPRWNYKVLWRLQRFLFFLLFFKFWENWTPNFFLSFFLSFFKVFGYHTSCSRWKIFFKRFYLFVERGREGEKHQCVVASPVPPTRDLARNPGMNPKLGMEPATLWFTAGTQSTKPHQPGLKLKFLC